MAALHSPLTVPTSARPAALLPLLLIGLLLPGGLRAAPPDGAPSLADAPQWRAAAAAALHAPPARLTLQTLPAATAGQAVTLDVVLAGVPRRIVLVPHSLRGPDFRVLAQGAAGRLSPVAVPPAATWRGRIEGVPGGLVHAARVGGRWHAALSLPREDGTTERWAIMPLRDLVPWGPADVVVLAPGEDLVAGEAACGVADGAAPPRAEAAPADVERLMALSPEQVLRIEIACDADSEFYGLNGKSVANTVADIEAVLNGSSLIYERDVQAALEIGTIIVRTAEPDPYSYTNPTTLLAEMLNEWKFNQTAVARDAAQLFTGKTLVGGIGISYRDGMCLTSSGYSAVQSRWNLVLDNRVQLSTHELAHNLDSPHCDGDDFNCRIMCPSFGGCSGGIHSFGPVEETRLRAALPTCGCLDTATVQIERATLPFSDEFTSGTLDATKWTAADRATQTSGRLQLDHTKGSGSIIYLGTVRTLPIDLVGNPTLSYKVLPSNVLAGQQFQVDYFDTVRRKWFVLNRVTAPAVCPRRTPSAPTPWATAPAGTCSRCASRPMAAAARRAPGGTSTACPSPSRWWTCRSRGRCGRCASPPPRTRPRRRPASHSSSPRHGACGSTSSTHEAPTCARWRTARSRRAGAKPRGTAAMTAAAGSPPASTWFGCARAARSAARGSCG